MLLQGLRVLQPVLPMLQPVLLVLLVLPRLGIPFLITTDRVGFASGKMTITHKTGKIISL